uniref:Interleukin-1 n=1 Tax=Lates calcarifer TaxID=8187 RepID=A0A4W6ESS2_LATCA
MGCHVHVKSMDGQPESIIIKIRDCIRGSTDSSHLTSRSSSPQKQSSRGSRSPLECTLTDNSQKDIICTSEDLKLQAVTLKGGNCMNFKLVQYISPNDGQTVVLSIRNHNFYISCSMTGDKAELNLEVKITHDLRSDPDMKRFLFFNREGPEICLHTFESVKYRGWFISTAYEKENEPLEMCRVDSAYRLTKFKIN